MQAVDATTVTMRVLSDLRESGVSVADFFRQKYTINYQQHKMLTRLVRTYLVKEDRPLYTVESESF